MPPVSNAPAATAIPLAAAGSDISTENSTTNNTPPDTGADKAASGSSFILEAGVGYGWLSMENPDGKKHSGPFWELGAGWRKFSGRKTFGVKALYNRGSSSKETSDDPGISVPSEVTRGTLMLAGSVHYLLGNHVSVGANLGVGWAKYGAQDSDDGLKGAQIKDVPQLSSLDDSAIAIRLGLEACTAKQAVCLSGFLQYDPGLSPKVGGIQNVEGGEAEVKGQVPLSPYSFGFAVKVSFGFSPKRSKSSTIEKPAEPPQISTDSTTPPISTDSTPSDGEVIEMGPTAGFSSQVDEIKELAKKPDNARREVNRVHQTIALTSVPQVAEQGMKSAVASYQTALQSYWQVDHNLTILREQFDKLPDTAKTPEAAKAVEEAQKATIESAKTVNSIGKTVTKVLATYEKKRAKLKGLPPIEFKPTLIVIPGEAAKPPATVTRPPATVTRPPATVTRPPTTVTRPPTTVTRPP
ncbi:MAG TPA: hypothetical protein DF383_05635, partial [Deltaproteobacteria bacterium]|nr:hypothetical protein [Deltaproteobacteria bacterium]